MRDRPRISEGRVLGSYCAAVAISVAVFFAGAAAWEQFHPTPPWNGPPFGAVDYVLVVFVAFFLVLVAGIVPFLAGFAVFRIARIERPVWFVAYGVATGQLLGFFFNGSGVDLLIAPVAGAAGGAAFRVLLGSQAGSALKPEP